jgi:hypothetical protein
MPLTWGFFVERVTGIEPALSAWEQTCHPRPAQSGVSGAHHRGAIYRRLPALPELVRPSGHEAGTRSVGNESVWQAVCARVDQWLPTCRQ